MADLRSVTLIPEIRVRILAEIYRHTGNAEPA
jgi:hypothetical protein